jgi:flagellar biogenesis protein FliO
MFSFGLNLGGTATREHSWRSAFALCPRSGTFSRIGNTSFANDVIRFCMAFGCMLLGVALVGTTNISAQESTEPGDVTWAIAEGPSTPTAFASYEQAASAEMPTEKAPEAKVTSETATIRRGQTRSNTDPAPLALAPSKRPPANASRSTATDASHNSMPRFGNTGMFTSLAIVSGGVAAALWFSRRVGSPRRGRLPTEIFEQLGKTPLGPKLEAHLLRVGGKLLLVSVQANETRTLTEITDPAEVQRIVALCATANPSTAATYIADTLANSRRGVATHAGFHQSPGVATLPSTGSASTGSASTGAANTGSSNMEMASTTAMSQASTHSIADEMAAHSRAFTNVAALGLQSTGIPTTGTQTTGAAAHGMYGNRPRPYVAAASSPGTGGAVSARDRVGDNASRSSLAANIRRSLSQLDTQNV